DEVQIRSFRIWRIGETVDEELVSCDGVVSTLHSVAAGADEAECIARAGRLRVRVEDLLKEFDCVLVLTFGIKSSGDLKRGVWNSCALRKPVDNSPIVKPRAREVSIEVVNRCA